MSSFIKEIITNCVLCNILLNGKNMVKMRKKCNKCLNNIRNKNKKPINKHVYENKTIKTDRKLIIGR